VGCSAAAAAAAVGFHSLVVVVVDSTSLFACCSMELYYGDPSPHVVGYASGVSISSGDWHRRQQQQQQQQHHHRRRHHHGSSSSSSSSHVAAGAAETAGLQGTLYITKSSFPTFSSHTIICEIELYCVTRSNQ
jgi:hypothetical protein